MRWTQLLPAAPLLVAVIAIAPLADASPPDPTWIGGLYDNGDLDDVIFAITSATAVLDARPVLRAEPTVVIVGAVHDTGTTAPPLDTWLAHQPRSPPIR